MDKSRLDMYAELIVTNGLNLDKGQQVLVIAELDQPEFVRMVVEKCYQHGSGKVFVDWTDMAIGKLEQNYLSEENLASWEKWQIEKWNWRADSLPALLFLESEDPDGMNGIDQEKAARARSRKLTQIRAIRDRMENKYQWCIAGVPGAAWAKKMFPNLSESEAIEAQWEAILAAARANGDALANWREHNENIHRRSKILNDYQLTALEYHSANGTDFRIGLMKEGLFAGAAETDLSGRVFNPNIPSEEVFTSPDRRTAEGIVYSTKPLSLYGTLVENFSIRFEGGRAVEIKAEKGQDVLEKLLEMDENAGYLGECALIPFDSPINQSGLLFYSTLYDENASCHLALGRGFADCFRDSEKYTKEERFARGLNDSLVHVDFMIGSEDLNIDGIQADGTRIPVFRNGKWAF